MVKVHAPVMSMEASGKLGNALVFAKWKGRAYARSLVKPHNPQSALQTGIRGMLRALSQLWKDLTAQNQGTWDELAEATNISPFNAYVAYNMRRWREGHGVTIDCPAVQEITPTLVATMTTVGAARHVDVAITLTSGTDHLGIVICRSTTTGFTPGWANAVRILFSPGDDVFAWIDAPLEPDTYYYRAASLTQDGKIGTYKAETSATVT